MVVGVLRIDLRLFDIHSLKQKRSVIGRILQRMRSRFPVSAAEVGYLDLLQRTQLGISMTAGSEALIHSVFRKLEEDIYQSGQAETLDSEVEYLHYGEKN